MAKKRIAGDQDPGTRPVLVSASTEAVVGDGAPAVAQEPANMTPPELTAGIRRVFVSSVCPEEFYFRAQGWFDGGQGSVLSDWSGPGGGTVMLPVLLGAEVLVQVQTSAPDGKRSGWTYAGTKVTPKPNRGGLTAPPSAR